MCALVVPLGTGENAGRKGRPRPHLVATRRARKREQLRQPVPPLRDVLPALPELEERSPEPQAPVPLVVPASPLERRVQVAVLALALVEPRGGIDDGRDARGPDLLREDEEVGGVSAAGDRLVAGGR